MSLSAIRATIAEVVGRPGSGIAVSLVNPPETLGRTFPLSWVNPANGTIQPSASDRYWTHNVQLLVYVAPRDKDLAAEFAGFDPLLESVPAVLWAAYLADEFPVGVAACWVDRYEIGLREWKGGDPFHAIAFNVRVEEETP